MPTEPRLFNLQTFSQNCVFAAQVKSFFVPAERAGSGRRGHGENQIGNKMLPISDDEFVVTFKD